MTMPSRLAGPASAAGDLFEPESRAFWRDEDLGAIFRHQLAAPLLAEVAAQHAGATPPAVPPGLSEGATLGEVLRHPAPPPGALRMVKDFAKAARNDPDRPLPPAVADALYHLAIAAALVRCGERISSLPDAELVKGVRWARGQAWLDPEWQALLAAAKAALAGAAGGGT